MHTEQATHHQGQAIQCTSRALGCCSKSSTGKQRGKHAKGSLHGCVPHVAWLPRALQSRGVSAPQLLPLLRKESRMAGSGRSALVMTNDPSQSAVQLNARLHL